ncbi:MAG: FAD-binding oxidoreductase [Fimbriimonadaceae bacterium]|nr:FAD-binding oxidoreductase [Fimbriimonadaceae bacterium]
MSAAPLLDSSRLRTLDGFSQMTPGASYVTEPTRAEEIAEIIHRAARARRPIVMRGNGRSYGDASVLPESVAISLARMREVRNWNAHTGEITVAAGASLGEIWRFALPDGFWLPVVSGTMRPQIGGAIGANIHGKNNWHAGTIGEHVTSLRIIDATGQDRTLTPADPDFWAVVGGYGLIGVLHEVTLRLRPVSSGNLLVTSRALSDWDAQFDAFEAASGADYAVSWIDGFRPGRGVFQSAQYVPSAEPASLRPEYQELPDRILGVLPKAKAWRVLRHLTHRPGMRLGAAAKYHAARLRPGETAMMPFTAFHFPLDYLPDWERAYAPRRLVQVQAAVSRTAAPAVFPRLFDLCRAHGIPPYLVVMKRHRPDVAVLPYLCDGYSLAMDFAVSLAPEDPFWTLYRKLVQTFLDQEGRFYFAKDLRLTSDDARHSVGIPRFEAFRAIKQRWDPEQVFDSALGRRIGLTMA